MELVRAEVQSLFIQQAVMETVGSQGPVLGTEEGGVDKAVPAFTVHSLQEENAPHYPTSGLGPDDRAPGKEELTPLFRKGLPSK